MKEKSLVMVTLKLAKIRKERNLKIEDILRIVNIARSTYYKWLNDFGKNPLYDIDLINNHNTKRISTRKSKSSNKLTDEIEKYIISQAEKENNIFKVQLTMKDIRDIFNVKLKRASIYYVLDKNKITYKIAQKHKYCVYSKETYKKKSAQLLKEINKVKRNICSIDETGINFNVTPKRKWKKSGEIAHVDEKKISEKYSIVMGMTKTKIVGYKMIKDNFNRDTFINFISENIKPKIKKASLFMDNASIHRGKYFDDKMTELNMNVIKNVPYSPQYNPIEFVLNTFKRYITNELPKNEMELRKCVEKFIKEQNKIGFKKYFDHCHKLLNEANK